MDVARTFFALPTEAPSWVNPDLPHESRSSCQDPCLGNAECAPARTSALPLLQTAQLCSHCGGVSAQTGHFRPIDAVPPLDMESIHQTQPGLQQLVAHRRASVSARKYAKRPRTYTTSRLIRVQGWVRTCGLGQLRGYRTSGVDSLKQGVHPMRVFCVGPKTRPLENLDRAQVKPHTMCTRELLAALLLKNTEAWYIPPRIDDNPIFINNIR